MENRYWQEYYRHHRQMNCPSPFCLWFIHNFPNLLHPYSGIVDICSGNGRDTYALAQYVEYIVGVDQSFRPDDNGNAYFVQKSISEFTENEGCEDILYARFALHAIADEDREILMDWCSKYLVVEMRSDKGESPDSTHYRKLINVNEFTESLSRHGFRILYLSENTGYAKTNSEDPMIIRAIATK